MKLQIPKNFSNSTRTTVIYIFLIAILPFCIKEDLKLKNNTISIAWIGPKSGPSSIIGVDSFRAVQLGIEEFRAKYPQINVDFYSEDDQYQSRNSIVKYERLVREYHINLLILATYSASKKISQLAKNDHVTVINPIDNDQKLSDSCKNVFFIAKRSESIVDLIVKQIKNSGLKKTLILYYDDDDFMPTLSSRASEQLQLIGVSSKVFSYNRKTINFRPAIIEARNFGADSFIFLGYEEIGLAIKQARTMGFKYEPFFTANLGTSVLNVAKNKADKVYFTDFRKIDSPSPEIENFLEAFKKRFQKQPDLLWTAVQSYDAINIALSAIQRNLPGSADDLSELFKTHLLEVKNYPGLSGNISISPDKVSNGIFWNLYQWSNNFEPKRVEIP